MEQNKQQKQPDSGPAAAPVSIQKELSRTEQLAYMRDFTERFGILMEGQMLQLRLWPFAVDPGIEKASADVDIEGKAVHCHWLKAGATPTDKKYKERLTELESAIRLLLGPTWVLTVDMNGDPIFPLKEKRVRKTRAKPKPSKKSKPASRAAAARPAKKRAKPRTSR